MFLEGENYSGKLQIISGKFQNNAINEVKQISLSHVISSEISISKRKWLCFGIYRSPSNENLEIFIEELTNSLSKASES